MNVLFELVPLQRKSRPVTRYISWLVVSTLLAVIVLLPSVSFAQQLTGTLSGTAYDQTGAVLPGATVVLKNEASGDTRKTKTNSAGYFTITAIQPATYSVTVSASGFNSWQENGIVINLGDSRALPNINLKVGSSTTAVDVVSGADATVPVDTAEVSTTLNAQMVQNITLGGRDAGELLKLMPGMALTNGGSQGSGFNPKVTGTNSGPVGAYSSNGTQPNGAMAFMLDGANLVDPGNAGTQIANINQDMVQEVKVLMSSYGAEYAKGPTIFEAFSKSGGTNFHGEGYFYARNSTFNSVESYAKSQIQSAITTGINNGLTPDQARAAAMTQAHPDEHYYYIGGNVGGPLILPFTSFNKDRKKLFFWVGYENMRQQPAGSPINYNVPTPAQLSGDFSNTGVDPNVKKAWSAAYASPVNNLPAGATSTNIPASTFDPNAAALLKAGYYPKPNITPSASNGWNNYTYVSALPQNRWEATGKVDYAITDNTKLTVSYSRQIETDQHPIDIWWAAPWTLPYPSGVTAATTSNLFLTNLTHVFNATTTNEFVFTFARYINPSKLANPAAVDRTKVGFNTTGLFGKTASQIPNIEGPWGGAFPNISEFSFDGSFNGGGTFGALKKDPALYDNFTKVIGTHTLKAGFYWDTDENLQSDSDSTAGDNGTYNIGGGNYETGNLVADFLLGHVNNYVQKSAIPVPDIRDHQWSVFAQDSWKATRKLTVNYGLRLDHMGQWYYGAPGIQVWDPASYSNSPNAPANTGLLWNKLNSSIPLSGWKSPLFYPEPRVGAAYDLFGTGRTVLRGGFAVFRYQVSSNDGCSACGGPIGAFNYTTPTGFIGYANNIQFTPPSNTSQNGSSLTAFQQGDDRTPQTMDWNATVSQALPWRSVFEVSYVGNKSTNEILNGNNGKVNDVNNVLPGAFFTPDPTTGQLVSPNAPANSGYPSFNANHFRPLANYQDVYVITHGSYANYNSLQTSWQKQSGPVTFMANYTFSKVLGIRDGQTSNGAGNGTMVDPFVLRNNYAPLAYDHTHIINAAYVWNMPSPIHGNAILSQVVNGWQLSGYTALQSGAPLQPSTGGNLNAQYPTSLPANELINLPNGLQANAISPSTWFGSNAYQALVPSTTCNPLTTRKSGQYFNPDCFTIPAYGKQGGPFPYLRNPAYFNSDLALFKSFRIKEGQNVQFRVQAQNFLNHPLRQFGLAGNSDEKLNFINSDNSLSATNNNTQTTGKPAFTTGQRLMTFVVKYNF